MTKFFFPIRFDFRIGAARRIRTSRRKNLKPSFLIAVRLGFGASLRLALKLSNSHQSPSWRIPALPAKKLKTLYAGSLALLAALPARRLIGLRSRSGLSVAAFNVAFVRVFAQGVA
jgi:hypothetical protein